MSHSQFINPVLDVPGLWFVRTLSGAFALCSSGPSALRKAYERSGQTHSPFDAPNALVRVGTDDRLDAEQIMAEWRNLGWPLPGSHRDKRTADT